MAAACVLTAPDHALAEALLFRGMLDGLTFFVSQDKLATVQERCAMKQFANPTALQGYKTDPGDALFVSFEGMPSQIDVPDGARHMVVGFGEGEGDPELESINVRIHDMLPPLSNSRDSTMFRSWMETSLRGEVPETLPSERFWFDLNDAVAALIELIKGRPDAATYNLAGRRGWTLEETWTEFHPLVQRTKAGQHGAFVIEHLVARGVPSVSVKEITDNGHNQRPSLSSIHAYLEKTTGEGWRPKTPLRQSLMLVIADLNQAP